MNIRSFLRTAPIAGLVILGFAASPAFGQQPAPLADSQILALITHQLNDKHIAAHVSASRGVVTLDGMVQSLWEREEAIDISRKTHDVQTVVSSMTIARAESDRAIADKATDQVRRYAFYTLFDDISVGVLDGVVTLRGEVTMPMKISEIVNLVSRIQGVQAVNSDVRALPASAADEQLRMSVASQIYRDQMFWDYSMQNDPPIHVIVDSGKVTLIGMVQSQVERLKAENIAKNAFGVISVDNHLRVAPGTN